MAYTSDVGPEAMTKKAAIPEGYQAKVIAGVNTMLRGKKFYDAWRARLTGIEFDLVDTYVRKVLATMRDTNIKNAERVVAAKRR